MSASPTASPSAPAAAVLPAADAAASLSAAEATERHRRPRFLRDVAATTLVQAALLPLSLATSVVIARSLGPAGKGEYTSIVAISEFALFFGAQGIGKAIVYLIPRHRDEERALQATTMVLSVVAALAVAGGLVAFSLAVMPSVLPTLPVTLSLFAIPLAGATVLRTSLEGLLRADHRNLPVNAAAIVFSAGVLLLVLFWTIGSRLTLTWALAGRVISLGCTVALLGWYLRRLPWRRLWRADGASVRRIARYGGPYALISLTQNLNYDLDVLLVQGMLSSRDVGIYSIGASTAELLWALPFAVGFVLLPMVAGNRDAEGAAAGAAAIARRTLLLTAAGAVALAALCGPLIGLMYGSRYTGAVIPTLILLPGIVANVWYQVLGGFLLGRGLTGAVLAATTAGIASNTIINVVVIPRLGIDGAALASTISYSATSLLIVRAFRSRWPEVSLRPARADVAAMTDPLRAMWRRRAGVRA